MVSVIVIVYVIVCVIICVVSCCVHFTKKNPCPIYYIMYGRTMRTVQQSIALLASLLCVLLLLLIVMYDFVRVYAKTIIMDWYVDNDDVS